MSLIPVLKDHPKEEMGFIPPIKAFEDDESLSWEERHKRLLAHHEEETTYLIAVIDLARNVLDYNLSGGLGRWLLSRRCDRILWRTNMGAFKVLIGLDRPYDPRDPR